MCANQQKTVWGQIPLIFFIQHKNMTTSTSKHSAKPKLPTALPLIICSKPTELKNLMEPSVSEKNTSHHFSFASSLRSKWILRPTHDEHGIQI